MPPWRRRGQHPAMALPGRSNAWLLAQGMAIAVLFLAVRRAVWSRALGAYTSASRCGIHSVGRPQSTCAPHGAMSRLT